MTWRQLWQEFLQLLKGDREPLGEIHRDFGDWMSIEDLRELVEDMADAKGTYSVRIRIRDGVSEPICSARATLGGDLVFGTKGAPA